MIGRYKKSLIAAIVLSFITFSLVIYYADSFSEMGLEITHINHFN